MPAKDDPNTKAPWTDEDTINLLRGMVHILLTSRPELYAIPELYRVSDHGGNRISKKLLQILKGVTKQYGDDRMVDEEIERLKNSRLQKGGSLSTEKRKSGGVGEESPIKKRRVKNED